MVFADGRVLTANSEENTDLFWAVRGGGSNFGVCTEFVFQLHDQRRTVYSGVLIYPKTMVEPLAEVTKAWVASGLKPKEAMLQVFTRSPPPENKVRHLPYRTDLFDLIPLCPQPCIACVVFYNGSEKEGRENFKSFLDLSRFIDKTQWYRSSTLTEPHDLTSEIPYEKLNSLQVGESALPVMLHALTVSDSQNDMVGYGRGVYMKGLNFLMMEPDHSREVLEKITALTSGKFIMGCVFEYFPHEKTLSVPNDANAINNRTNRLNVLTHSMWLENTPENVKIGRENVRTVTDYIASLQTDVHSARYRAYGNYCEFLGSPVFGC